MARGSKTFKGLECHVKQRMFLWPTEGARCLSFLSFFIKSILSDIPMPLEKTMSFLAGKMREFPRLWWPHRAVVGAQRDFSHRKSYSGNWGGTCDWGPANQSITFLWSQWLAQEWSNQNQGDYFPETLVGEACFLLYQPCIWEKIKPGYARGNGVDKGPLVKESEPRNGEKLNSVMPFQTLHAAMSEIQVNLWMILLHETIKFPFPSDKVPIPELQSHHLWWEESWYSGRAWSGKGSGASAAVRRTSVHPARPNENATIFVQPSNHSSLHS